MKTCVLTANSNNKDHINFNEKYLDKDFSYFYYTDTNVNHDKWKVKKLPEFSFIDNFSDRRNAKIIKILGFLFEQNYDYYVWMDSSIRLKVNIKTIFDSIGYDYEFCVFKHGLRNNIIDEAKELIYYGLDKKDLIIEQINNYDQKNYELYELPFFIYKNTQKTQNFLYSWYEQISKYSSRDQLSFPYCVDKYNIQIKKFEGSVYNNNYFFIERHLK